MKLKKADSLVKVETQPLSRAGRARRQVHSEPQAGSHLSMQRS